MPARLTSTPGELRAVTAMLTVACAPLASVPSVQVTSPPFTVQLPWEELTAKYAAPAGNAFVSTTLVAVFGPRLLTVMK